MIPSPSVSSLPFHKIPHQPDVFLKYVGLSAEVLSFYHHPPALRAFDRAAAEVRGISFPRLQMAEILQSQNETFGSSDAVRSAIADLTGPDCVAVVTGQQAGLFTGPVYTIYKALTALRLSEELRRRGLTAVPIFWMASDDHDLAEITRLKVPAPGRDNLVLDGRELLFGTTNLPPRPVGSIALPATASSLLDEYTASFAGEWRHPMRAQLASACQPGMTFTESFGHIMAQLFEGRGLVLFDPRDARAKRLAAPVIETALRAARSLRTQLAERGQALQASGLAAQVAVLPRSSLVFLEENGERRLLVESDGRFVLKDRAKKYFTIDELIDLLKNAPERFSPNVLLRPVVQDSLFPTVAYVGGPSEVSYFAQVAPIYESCNRPMPVIWPRSSFTVIQPEIRAIMQRPALTLEDCFQGRNHVLRKILQARPSRFDDLLAGLRRCADHDLELLKPALVAADASLGPAADNVKRKLMHRVTSLETKFGNFRLRQDSALREAMRFLFNHCYPDGNLQERELGVHYLLASLGPSLLDAVYETIDLQAFTHRVLSY